MKHKSPSILNSKVIRISLDTYQVLRGLSLRDGITIAEALTKLITGLAKSETKGLPVAELVAIAIKPAFRVTTPVSIATNGGGAAAFRIKTKGARYD